MIDRKQLVERERRVIDGIAQRRKVHIEQSGGGDTSHHSNRKVIQEAHERQQKQDAQRKR